MKLLHPIVVDGRTITELRPRKMTMFDHERTKRLDAMPRVIKLASLLCGVPEAAIRDLDASDFERLAEEILSSRPA